MSQVKVFSVVLVVLVSNSWVLGSAIPMWEFLSRGEKMSHLFNMFGKQVQEYCNSQSMPDCNKVLMVYGMKNLAKMNDEHLDTMDPYQRGATDIIWDSMMKGTYKADEATDKQDNPHKDQEDFYSTGSEALEPSVPQAGNSLGSQEEASSIEEYLSPPPSRFLVGPMVIRVMPDGRPVPGDSQRPLPKDEDAEEFKLMRAQPVPSVAELMRRMSSASSSYSPTAQARPPHAERYQQTRGRPAYSLPQQFRIHSV